MSQHILEQIRICVNYLHLSAFKVKARTNATHTERPKQRITYTDVDDNGHSALEHVIIITIIYDRHDVHTACGI